MARETQEEVMEVSSAPQCNAYNSVCLQVVITALEKFHWENTAVARWVKVELDRRLGCSWHAVVGEQFSFDTTYEVAIRRHEILGKISFQKRRG